MADSKSPHDSLRVDSRWPEGVETLEALAGRTRQDLRSRILENAFDHAPFGVLLCDLEWHAVDANDAFSRFIGYRRDQIPGMPIAAFVHPADADLDITERRRLVA